MPSLPHTTMNRSLRSFPNPISLLSRCTRNCIAALIVMASAGPVSAADAVLYTNDFEQANVGSVPDDFLVLNGNFEVKAEDSNKFLELPGAPLDTFAVLFGPKGTDGFRVDARVFTTNQGRKYSAFAVGLNGVAGYRVQVSPAKRAIELYQSDDIIASIPHAWKSGVWTQLSLRVMKTGEMEWRIEGKVWVDGGEEPAEWMITHTATSEPFSGQASVWGKPFAGTPIRYDNLRVIQAK